MRKNPPYVWLSVILLAAGGLVPLPVIAQVQTSSLLLVKPAVKTTFAKPDEQARKFRTAYRASRVFLYGATVFDASTTVQVMNHPTIASRPDGSVIARYHGTETGWASYFGKQNTFAAVTANVGLNVGVDWLSRRMYRRGGKWRMAAIGLNLAKGTGNLVCGIHNIRTDAGVDRRIRMATGYRGPISWSH